MLKLTEANFTDKQLEYLRCSNHRLNICSGSVRSGKTIATIFRWIHFIKYSRGNLLMVGRTERTLARNILDPMKAILGNSFNYNRGLGEVRINDRLIYVCGANNSLAEEKIRGLTLAGTYVDEITILPESFFKMLLSRLSLPNAKLFGSTNCDGPYHYLKTQYIDNKDLDLINIEFSLDDNTFLDPTYVRNLKKEYSGLYHLRFIDGLWVLAEGSIYDMWDPDEHVVNHVETQNKHIVGIDYGTSNPCTFLLFGFNDKNKVWLETEYYYNPKLMGKQKTDAEYADDLEKFLGNINPQMIYIDPSAVSLRLELKKKNKWNLKTANNEVLPGLAFVSSMLKSNKLFVHNRCIDTKKEFSSYVWDPKAQKQGIDKPLKVNDHTMDALRYALYSHFHKNIQGKVDMSMTKMFGGTQKRW